MLRIFRSLVTIVVVGTMAVMVYSQRAELKDAKARIRELSMLRQDGVFVLCKIDLNDDADIDLYKDRTLGVVPKVRAEKGCQLYAFLEDAETNWDAPQKGGERTFWMVEKWDSVPALQAHLQSPHMKAFGPSVKSMRANSTFRVLQEVH